MPRSPPPSKPAARKAPKRRAAPAPRTPPAPAETVFAAIDVGTNAMRLELARPRPDGSVEVLHQERDPVRPGEGVFRDGRISREVADRVISTLRRYAALSRRFGATTRAVATSAIREARNRDEVVRRARREAGIELEVIHGQEEARLICLGVLGDAPERARALVIDIGGGSTEVARSEGAVPTELHSLDLGAVRLTEMFELSGKVPREKLALMRSFAARLLDELLPPAIARGVTHVYGSSGTIKSIVGFAADGPIATARQLGVAVEQLARLDGERRRRRFDANRADIIVAGAVILEAIVQHLKVPQVAVTDRGLRDGLIADLVRRARVDRRDHVPADGALTFARRFPFDEPHAVQVSKLALQLFDALAPLHRLPAAHRPLLEVAGLLHDVGSAVSYQRHHKHSAYLIRNAELPGLGVREKEWVATMARFHRRSLPLRDHEELKTFSASEWRELARLTALLRMADAFDRSHRQPVRKLAVQLGTKVLLTLESKQPLDLELWDAHQELEFFRRMLGRPVEVRASR